MRRSRPGGGGKRKRPEQIGRLLGAGDGLRPGEQQGFMLLIGPPAVASEDQTPQPSKWPPKRSWAKCSPGRRPGLSTHFSVKSAGFATNANVNKIAFCALC